MTLTRSTDVPRTEPAGDDRPFRRTDVLRFLVQSKQREDPLPDCTPRCGGTVSVHHSIMGVTLVSGYDEVLAVVKSPDASSDETRMDRRFGQGRFGAGRLVELPARSLLKLTALRLPGSTVGPFTEMARRFMLLTDPPDHERLRRLVVRAFTPRTVERMVPAHRGHRLRATRRAGSPARWRPAVGLRLPPAGDRHLRDDRDPALGP